MADSYHKLEAWIISKKEPSTGKVRTGADGNPDLTGIELNNNNGTINRTWLAKHLQIYDRSAFKTARCTQAIKAFEKELGIHAPSGKKPKLMTASQEQLERMKAEKEKLANKLLQVSANLKEAQKEIQERNRQLKQYAEIRRFQLETGRNVPGLHVVALRQEEK
ncbi:hypothetical protein AB4Z32_20945 [Massilia sp. 2TAF26]|uniref:hypothetical protein n=1 Tax=Massilia sp. 2TAF26 TaxID=3233012 RepID=UPI003F9CFC7B